MKKKKMNDLSGFSKIDLMKAYIGGAGWEGYDSLHHILL